MNRVTSNALPTVEFSGWNTFVLAVGSGADTATFATANLFGAQNYQVVTGFADTLVIEGTSTAGEQFRVTNPPGAPVVAVTDLIFARTITDTSTLLGLLLINTLGGDDLVAVDVNSPASDVIGIPITFDG